MGQKLPYYINIIRIKES